MKILICYFSNTGNTEKVAYAIKEGLIDHEVDIIKVQEFNISKIADYDLVFLGSGIYASKINKAVQMIVKKAKQLPPYFVFFTTHSSPEHYQHSFKRVRKELEKKNAEVIGEWDCRGANIGVPKQLIEARLEALPPEERKKAEEDIKALEGRPSKEDLKKATEFASLMIKKIS